MVNTACKKTSCYVCGVFVIKGPISERSIQISQTNISFIMFESTTKNHTIFSALENTKLFAITLQKILSLNL